MSLRHFVLALFALTLLASSANGWNKDGHQVVATIAFDRLTPAERTACAEILRQHPRFKEDFKRSMPRNLTAEQQERWIFLRAAIWPDLVRPSPKHPNWKKAAFHRGNWHFINEPFYLTPDDEEALADRHGKNLARTLDGQTPEKDWNILQALEHNMAVLKDANADPKSRAVSLCWVLHLVGDIHQPLHSTALFSRPRFREGDRGGNSIPIKPPQTGGFRFPYDPMSLHSIWDDILGHRLSDRAIANKATGFLEDPDLQTAGARASTTLNPESWMLESHRLAVDIAYDQSILEELRDEADDDEQEDSDRLEPFSLPMEYYLHASEVAKQRAVEAGFRLASVVTAQLTGVHDARSDAQPSSSGFSSESAMAASADSANAIVSICSFNIQFLGQSTERDNVALAALVRDHDIVVVQELLAPPYDGTFPDGEAFRPDPEATAFFDQMKGLGFQYILSEEDTGKSETNHNNGSATEWFVAFYKPSRVSTANDLRSEFLASDRTANANFDRVPYAFGFRTPDRRMDFVLISVHLRPSAGTANAARRKHELASIAQWVQSRPGSEKDYIILGDMNIENATELLSATPAGFQSINFFKRDANHPNDYCLNTNTNVNGPKPYDHVMLNAGHTREYDAQFGFKVIDLIEAMRAGWLSRSNEPYPGDPYDHTAFRMTYSDHHPVVFQLRIPARDDD